MKKNSKTGLRRFTESQEKIRQVMSLKVVTYKDIDSLTEKERGELTVLLTEQYSQLKGAERDAFDKKYDQVTTPEAKNEIWEANHHYITQAINSIILSTGRVPSKREIADATNLSRVTVGKHFKEYLTHPLHLEHLEKFRLMASKVLATVYEQAARGNIKAARLYFEIIGDGLNQPPVNTFIKNQNNYLQINGTMLTQEKIKQLQPGQLIEIENIIKSAEPIEKQLEKS